LVNPVAFLGAMPKVEGFAPLVSTTAKSGMVWQTHDMMLIGGMTWAWGQRLVKSLSNDAFNELNGRKKIEIGGAPIDKQINTASVKDGLFQLAKPYFDASKRHFENEINTNKELQEEILNKTMELEKSKLVTNAELMRWMFTNVPELAHALITGDFSKLGGGKVHYNNQPQAGAYQGTVVKGQEREDIAETIRKNKEEGAKKLANQERPYTVKYSYIDTGYNGSKKQRTVRITLTYTQHLQRIKQLSDAQVNIIKRANEYKKNGRHDAYKFYMIRASDTARRIKNYLDKIKSQKP
jgi:hypothetical protein